MNYPPTLQNRKTSQHGSSMKFLGKLILTSMALLSMGTVMAGEAVVNDARLS